MIFAQKKYCLPLYSLATLPPRKSYKKFDSNKSPLKSNRQSGYEQKPVMYAYSVSEHVLVWHYIPKANVT